MELKLTVDRIEEGFSVCFDSNEKQYKIRGSFPEGAVLICETGDGGELKVISISAEETEEKKSKNAARLAALFARGDRKK